MRSDRLSAVLPRVALYSILTAIEEDVRALLARHLGPQAPSEVLGHIVAERAIARGLHDLGAAPVNLPELLPYVDFGDVWGHSSTDTPKCCRRRGRRRANATHSGSSASPGSVIA